MELKFSLYEDLALALKSISECSQLLGEKRLIIRENVWT